LHRRVDDSIVWVVPKHYPLPRKVVVKSFEALDKRDSPDRPGMMLESTLRLMVSRFYDVFVVSEAKKTAMSERIQSIQAHLQRHTLIRRGETVLKEGFVEWEQTSKIYGLFTVDLNVFERIFFTIDVSEGEAVLSKICSLVLVFMIIVSIVVWMISTLPVFQVLPSPEECSRLEVNSCAPRPMTVFQQIDTACVLVFTTEYLVRLLTVHSVRFQLLDEFFLESLLTGQQTSEAKLKNTISRSMAQGIGEQLEKTQSLRGHRLDGKLMTTIRHVFGIASLIDLGAILPFWLEQLQGDGSGGGALVVLRVLRLTRIFRVFKLGKYNELFALFSCVIHQSLPALSLMLFFICLACCLFGTLVWFAEQGDWYPQGHEALLSLADPITDRGAYLRHDGSLDPDALEESPFASIVHSFWYVVVTITTVGYGDISPTTPVGKLVGALTILNGVIVLAMPIGVVGANFSSEYYGALEEKERRWKAKQAMSAMAAVEEECCKEADDEETVEIGGSSGRLSAVAVELRRVNTARQRIVVDAEDIDTRWKHVLKDRGYCDLSMHLRQFLSSFLSAGDVHVGKTVVSMGHLAALDALTVRVHAALTSWAEGKNSREPALKEIVEHAFELRRQWASFTQRCWAYVVELCHIVASKEPPEFFEMRSQILCPRPSFLVEAVGGSRGNAADAEDILAGGLRDVAKPRPVDDRPSSDAIAPCVSSDSIGDTVASSDVPNSQALPGVPAPLLHVPEGHEEPLDSG